MLDKIPFKVSARTARLIGRENVATAKGAIIELVKNGYDADSPFSIVLIDNRYGVYHNRLDKELYEKYLSLGIEESLLTSIYQLNEDAYYERPDVDIEKIGVLRFRYIFAVIAAFVWLYLTSNASLKILSMKDFAISKNVSITFLARILIILVFLVPIVMRIVINWLYSTVYVKYLDVQLTEEYVAYQNTKKAIRSKNKDLCDLRYDGVYKEVFFSADKSQDNVETVLVNKLLDYLSFACKPVRVLELLCYRFSADYRNDNNNVVKVMRKLLMNYQNEV